MIDRLIENLKCACDHWRIYFIICICNIIFSSSLDNKNIVDAVITYCKYQFWLLTFVIWSLFGHLTIKYCRYNYYYFRNEYKKEKGYFFWIKVLVNLFVWEKYGEPCRSRRNLLVCCEFWIKSALWSGKVSLTFSQRNKERDPNQLINWISKVFMIS